MIQPYIEATFSLVGDGTSTSFDIPITAFGVAPNVLIAATVQGPTPTPTCAPTLSPDGSTVTLNFSSPLLAATDGVYVIQVQYTS